MSRHDPSFSGSFGSVRIEGFSAAGVETWFRIDPPGISFDIGRCPARLIPVSDLFVTHPHTDHAAGIVYHAAQRKLNGLPPATLHLPRILASRYESLLDAYGNLYGSRPPVTIDGVEPGDARDIGSRFRVRAWPASHTVPALSWELQERHRALKPELEGKSAEEVKAALARGTEVSREQYRSLLFYSGDTDVEIFRTAPALFDARTLILECTFTSPGHYDRAEKYRHLHLDRIAERALELDCETLILTHFSLRDHPQEIVRRVRSAFPDTLIERTQLVIGDQLIVLDKAGTADQTPE